MTDAIGQKFFQNFKLVVAGIAANNPPTYKLPLQNILMTTGSVVSQDLTNFNNPDEDGDVVSIQNIN